MQLERERRKLNSRAACFWRQNNPRHMLMQKLIKKLTSLRLVADGKHVLQLDTFNLARRVQLTAAKRPLYNLLLNLTNTDDANVCSPLPPSNLCTYFRSTKHSNIQTFQYSKSCSRESIFNISHSHTLTHLTHIRTFSTRFRRNATRTMRNGSICEYFDVSV